MISDVDIWCAAMAMVKRYGDGAMLEAAVRTDQMLAACDWEGVCTGRRILHAIERLQAKAPAEGEKVH